MNYTLTIDRTSLGKSALVLHGDRQPGWSLMPGWQLPGLDPEVYTASSASLDGSPVVDFTWRDGIISGDVLPIAEDASDLAALVADLREAIGRVSYPIETVWNDADPQTWTARVGSLMPSPIRWIELSRNELAYSLTIPVHPIPGA